MSDDEDDIWGYRSIRKHKASDQHVDQTGSQEQARKSAAQAKRGGKREKNAPKKTKEIPVVTSPQPVQEQNAPGSQEDALTTPKRTKVKTVKTPSPVTPQNTYSGHCPSCQMPFSLLLVQTPRWHVSECLDAPTTAQTECPDGIRCSSALPSHYKRYSHCLLAQIRAVVQPSFSPPCTPATLNLCNGFTPATVRKSPKLKSPKSCSPSSSQESLPRTALDVWLSSPSKASQDSSSSSQESAKCHPPTQRDAEVCQDSFSSSHKSSKCPHVTQRDAEVCQDSFSSSHKSSKCRHVTQRDAEVCDSAISYSPLDSDQELFSDDEDDLESAKKTPHLGRASPDKTAVIESPPKSNKDHNGGNAQMMAADYWSEYSTPVSGISDWPPEGAADLSSDHQHLVFPIKTQGDGSSPVNSQPRAPIRASQAMPSVPCAKAMKQTDIGVFFGLKPKVVPAEVKVPLKTQTHNAIASQNEKAPRKRKATGSFGDVAENISGIPVSVAAGSQKGGAKRFRQNSNTEEQGRGRKQCPFYKKIPGTGFAVDAFQYGEVEGCAAYFLTHFHSDHYGGLTKKFRFPIYCSKITGNLVQSKLRVEKEFINCLPMYTECTVNGVRVVLLDANHCPGAVLLLFILPNGTTVLHTGDFRADPSMERYPELLDRKVHTLYLDTTYCSPEYTFPPQQEAVQFAVNSAFEAVTLHPRTLVVCGTYSIGKEKVFLAIADVLGCKVCMSQDKYKTMQCLESDEIGARVTTDWHSTTLHVLPMMQVHFKGLTAHLNKFSGKYDRVLAFKPTGWTYSEGRGSVADTRPQIRGKVTIYGIPYSEHSSYSEMKRFVQFLKPQKIIPTVNVGNVKCRAAMEKHFTEWLSDTRRR